MWSTYPVDRASLPQDSRVRVVRLPENVGVSAARNVGATRSEAPVIAFLDDDDEWLPEKLERQLAMLDRHPRAPFVFTNFVREYGDRRTLGRHEGAVLTYHDVLQHSQIHLSSVALLRTTFAAAGGFDERMRFSEDADLWLRLLATREPAVLVDEPLTIYHQHDENVTAQNALACSIAVRSLLRTHRGMAARAGDIDTVLACEAGLRRSQELMAYQAWDNARDAWRRRAPIEALRSVATTVQARPAVAWTGATEALRARRARRSRAVKP